MTALVELTIRVTIVVGAGLVAAFALRRRSAATRHAALAGALLAAALVIPLGRVLPAWKVSVPPWTSPRVDQTSAVIVGASAVPAARPAPAAGMSLRALVTGLWLAGVLAASMSMTAGLFRLRRIRNEATQITDGAWASTLERLRGEFGVRRPIALLQSEAPDLIATWGLARPCIALPRSADAWPQERAYAVLCHEVAHIARGDWPVQLAAQAICALQWFNPACWIAYRRLRQLSELACDDRALSQGLAPADYAMHLIEVTRTCRRSRMPLPAVPMARPSTLERRVTAMLSHRIDRSALSRRALAAIAVGVLGVAAPTALIRAADADPRPLTGVVYDSSGAVLPDAVVTLDDGHQAPRETKTDGEGHFAFDPVGAGTYALRVAVPGFATLAENVELHTAGDWARSITLQVGDLQETVTIESRRTAAAPQASAPTRLKVGGNIRAPRKLVSVNAVYPESMKVAGVEGKVPLEAIIGQDGTVRSVRVLTSQIHPDLAVAAADAVRQWKFEPTLLNGAPVEVIMRVTIDFRLKG